MFRARYRAWEGVFGQTKLLGTCQVPKNTHASSSFPGARQFSQDPYRKAVRFLAGLTYQNNVSESFGHGYSKKDPGLTQARQIVYVISTSVPR